MLEPFQQLSCSVWSYCLHSLWSKTEDGLYSLSLLHILVLAELSFLCTLHLVLHTTPATHTILPLILHCLQSQFLNSQWQQAPVIKVTFTQTFMILKGSLSHNILQNFKETVTNTYSKIQSKGPGEEMHKICKCNNSAVLNRYRLLDSLNQ